MRQEVTAYTSKLTELETKQFDLVRENFELKQLCLLLDNAINVRENGDGSTGSTSEEPGSDDITNGNVQSGLSPQIRAQRMAVSQQTLEYIRTLEDRIQQLEWEKVQTGGNINVVGRGHSRTRLPVDLNSNADTIESYDTGVSMTNTVTKSPRTTKVHDNGQVRCPPAIADAMRVLRIHDSMKSEQAKNAEHGGQSMSSLKRPTTMERKMSAPGGLGQLSGHLNGSGRSSSRRNSTDNHLEEMTIEEQRNFMRSLAGGSWDIRGSKKVDEDIV
jgi:hypothetical protein